MDRLKERSPVVLLGSTLEKKLSRLVFRPGFSKCVVYLRYSTYEQMKKGFSDQRQLEKNVGFAAMHGQPVWKVYSDKAKTGTNLDRAAWKRMLKEIEPFPGSVIIAEGVSRAARGSDTHRKAREEAAAVNATIIYVDLGEVTSDAEDEAAMRSQHHHHERKQLLRDGKEQASKLGVWGAPVPAGYEKNADKRLVRK
jgi:DNA invertase Pin-like site-specific DNA recombinase